MGAPKLSTETVFRREFARFYAQEISFTPEAERQVRLCPEIGLNDVLYVLRKGRVKTNNKEDAEGATWMVYGKTCDETELNISVKVWTDRYSIRVLSVRMTGADHG